MASPTAGMGSSGAQRLSKLTNQPWRTTSRLLTFEADQERQDDAFDPLTKLHKTNSLLRTAAALKSWRSPKAKVSRYTCKGTSFNVASRNGDLYVSDATAANVTAISFAPFDLNGNPTRPVSAGDIVEFVESANLKSVGQVSRFRIVSGDDPSALTVTYLNGTNNFAVDETEEVYIYPQNEETASKEYVDSNFLPLTGGSLTGQLNTDSLIKSTRNTGYGLQLKPDNGDCHFLAAHQRDVPFRRQGDDSR